MNNQTLQQFANSSNNLVSNVATPNDSVFSYFWNAGWLIKTVIITLIIASVYSWSFIFSTHIKLKKLNRDADEFEEEFWSGEPLDSVYENARTSASDPMTNVFCAAMSEWEQAMRHGNADPVALLARIEKTMDVTINREVCNLEKGLPILSSIGTNGVIIGLFGTVIGILNGFKTIATQQSTSISLLGPIISEALITTAFGIITAIPAAFGYNKQRESINRYINRLEVFAQDFSLIMSRQINTNKE